MKLIRYAQEAKFAWKVGANFGSRLKLILHTLRFHISNARRASTSAATLPDGFQLRFNKSLFPIWLRKHGGDVFVFYEVFMDGCYSLGKAAPAAGKPLRIIDLGANIGITARYYETLYPGSRFACVEPRPSNVKSLRKNLEGMNAVVFEAAAAAQAGTARFDVSSCDWGGALAIPESAVNTIEVRMTTMDEIISAMNFDAVDILKIDIEGAERELLRGNPSWLRKVSRIVIELHGDYGIADFRSDVAKAGFEVYEQGSAEGNPMIVAVRR